MNYIRDLTINQMIVVLVFAVVVLIGAVIAFNVIRQPDNDPVPTATPFRPGGSFQLVVPTPMPTPQP